MEAPDPWERSCSTRAAAALAMVEGYGMTQSPIFRSPARKALLFLMGVDSEAKDARSAAFRVMPLSSARLVNEAAVERGMRAPLDLEKEEALRDSVVRLAKHGDSPDGPVETVAAAWLRILVHAARPEALPVHSRTPDAAYGFFGALVAHQLGGETWKRWDEALDLAVRGTQRTDTDISQLLGSWDPEGSGDRTVSTALLAMSLEASYRYERIR